jgi:tetratricopeptide (TPR) repeat protein
VFPSLQRFTCALVLCLLPVSADAAWTRLDTAHFLLIGDAPEGRIRKTAEHLEMFREVFNSLLGATGARETRTIVFVFGSDRSFAPYRPLFNGKPVEVAGYFQGSRDHAYIALGNSEGDASLRVIFHEYSHHIVDSSLRDVSAWASEGLAGLYETFEVAGDGKSVNIGVPSTEHLTVLRSSTLMPIRELIAVKHDSPVYNEGNRRGLFYAQAWALTHYLTFGPNEARRRQFERYLTTFSSAVPPEAAFRDIFGDERVLDTELRDYIRTFTMKMLRVTFTEKVTGATNARGEPLDDAEAGGYLGELLANMGRMDEARALFEKALARRGDAIVPAIGRGNLALHDGDPAEAVRLLEDVSARAANNSDAQMALARALIVLAQQADTPDRAVLARLRRPLTRVLALDPSNAEAAALSGYVELRTEGDTARAVELLRRAVTLAPRREDYQMYLAEGLVEQRDFEGATSVLGPLIGSGSRPEVRTAARNMLGYVADLRAAERARNQRLAAASSPAPGAAVAKPSAPALTLDLRRVGAGEERVLGVLTGVDCRTTPALLVSSNGATLRLLAATLDQVTFLTYRTDAAAAVNCGTLPTPQRVLATFTRQPNGALAAVAIELLPDGYELPYGN